MREIIIAYPNEKTAVTLRQTLIDNSLPVAYVCYKGSTALQIADTLGDGVIICPLILPDMPAYHLAEMLPNNFDVIALAKGYDSAINSSNITLINLPLNRNNFIDLVSSICYSDVYIAPKRKEKTSDKKNIIDNAKSILMLKQNISESAAHKSLQKISMDKGQKLVDTALQIIKENT